MRTRYQENIKKNKRLQKQLEKVDAGEGDYFLADLIANEVADAMSDAFNVITEDKLPNEKMYYNIGIRVIKPMFEELRKMMSDVLFKIQTSLNKKAGLKIKAVRIDEE